jgi:hypothetical protein
MRQLHHTTRKRPTAPISLRLFISPATTGHGSWKPAVTVIERIFCAPHPRLLAPQAQSNIFVADGINRMPWEDV